MSCQNVQRLKATFIFRYSPSPVIDANLACLFQLVPTLLTKTAFDDCLQRAAFAILLPRPLHFPSKYCTISRQKHLEFPHDHVLRQSSPPCCAQPLVSSRLIWTCHHYHSDYERYHVALQPLVRSRSFALTAWVEVPYFWGKLADETQKLCQNFKALSVSTVRPSICLQQA